MQFPTKSSQIFNLLRDLSYTRREISIAQERERQLQKDIEKLEGSGISQSLQETKESHQERGKLVILNNLITPKPDLDG
jgi:hypothetical protein